jgi:hypothetical protein
MTLIPGIITRQREPLRPFSSFWTVFKFQILIFAFISFISFSHCYLLPLALILRLCLPSSRSSPRHLSTSPPLITSKKCPAALVPVIHVTSLRLVTQIYEEAGDCSQSNITSTNFVRSASGASNCTRGRYGIACPRDRSQTHAHTLWSLLLQLVFVKGP